MLLLGGKAIAWPLAAGRWQKECCAIPLARQGNEAAAINADSE